MSALPEQVVEALTEANKQKRTGQLVLDLKDGKILGWRFLQKGRLDKTHKYPLD